MYTRLAEVRQQKHLSQGDLGALLNVSRGQVGNWEAGNRKINLEELRACAKALKCTVGDLLLPEDVPNQPNEIEASVLRELRGDESMDMRALLIAARAVVAAARSVQLAQSLPATISGDPELASALTRRWNGLDDNGRRGALALLDTAQEFGRAP